MTREEEAARRFEVTLREGVGVKEMLAKCSITEIGEILGVSTDAFERVRIQAKGGIGVTCKKAED